MTYEIVYKMCMIISTMVELYVIIDFFKTFHSTRTIFDKISHQILFGAAITFANIFVDLQNSRVFHFLGAACLYFFICMVFVEGNVWSRIFHWLLLVVVTMCAELIVLLLLRTSTKDAINGIICILTIKLLQFILLTVIKQLSKIKIQKVSGKVFATFLLMAVATFGVMILTPYIRKVPETISEWEIILILFYLWLLVGNISLFYVFTTYSKMLEERMLQQLSVIRYEEWKQRNDGEDVLVEQYKERIHNIKYYLKQIGIYLEGKQYKKIAEVLAELKIGIHKEEKDLICSDRFLNALLTDYREIAKKNHVHTEVFVESGFKIDFMKEVDVISILGNLIDNALEAARQCENGMVSIALYMENGGSLAVCRIENNYVGVLRNEGTQLLTSKEYPELHGIGLQNVKRLVEKYRGYMQQEYEKGVYVATLIFPAQENV